jgi:hypothetical protein
MSAVVELLYEDIEFTLMNNRSASTLLPRFTPVKWWECDLCEVTRAGYFKEYEIKLSRADFKVDAKKEREVFVEKVWDIPRDQRPRENKHSLLAAGDPRGPAEFYFVTSPGLLTEQDLPSWAGLIEVHRYERSSYASEKLIRKAPRLHRVKADAQVRAGMLASGHGRFEHFYRQRYLVEFEQRVKRAQANALLKKEVA